MPKAKIEMRQSQAKMRDMYEAEARMRIPGEEEESGFEET